MKTGTRVKLTNSSEQGTIVAMHGDSFQVLWDGAEDSATVFYPYSAMFNTGVRNADVEIIPFQVPGLPTDSTNAAERAIYYAGLIGAMEYRISDLYSSIAHARQCLEDDNTVGAKWHLTWCTDRIEETAEYIANKPRPQGMRDHTYLRDTIYGNRK